MSDDAKLSFFDRITGKVGKITASFLAVSALGTAVLSLTGVGKSLFELIRPEEEAAPSDLKSCLQAQLSYPEVVSRSQWDSMDMRVRGQNDCKAKLSVYVAFRGRADRIRLEPPFGETEDLWEQGMLATGAVDWRVSPPRLVPLRDSLGDRFKVDINWVVYNTETKAQIHADTARLWIEDDQPSAAASTVSTAPL